MRADIVVVTAHRCATPSCSGAHRGFQYRAGVCETCQQPMVVA